VGEFNEGKTLSKKREAHRQQKRKKKILPLHNKTLKKKFSSEKRG